MNLRAVDLQLLVAFEALVAELHVTRAAKTLGLSQPAVSHILARLRELFGDPLLVRSGNGLAPTARALELVEPIREALQQVRKVFDAQKTFDPATSGDSFVVRMGDMNEFLTLPSIASALEREAPGISIVVKYLPPLETVKALEAGEIDFAVSAELVHTQAIRSVVLLDDELVCIMRKDHPAAKRRLTLKAYLELKHINTVQSSADTRFIEQHLPRDAQRVIPLTLPHWLAAPSLVKSTQMVAAISRRMADAVNAGGDFAVRPLPVGLKRFAWRLYWHARHDSQPAHKWVRELVLRSCQALS
jgi:DNA-binding transcriptional LysR family regulator